MKTTCTTSQFFERANSFISPEKADTLINGFKANTVGRFFSSTPGDNFTHSEYELFMGADSSAWSVDGFRFIEAHENECTASMQHLMREHFNTQLRAVSSFIEALK